MYKQAVQSTDVYLGMGGKDESSTSCEEMVIKVTLPDVSTINGECLGIAWGVACYHIVIHPLAA